MSGNATTSMRRVAGPAALGLGAFVLGVGLAMPSNLLGRPGTRTLFLSFEFGVALIALVASARSGSSTRATAWTRRLIVALYSLVLLFLFYENLFAATYHRDPALIDDRTACFHFCPAHIATAFIDADFVPSFCQINRQEGTDKTCANDYNIFFHKPQRHGGT